MKKEQLIPVAALMVGAAGCSPDYVGDWELTKMTASGPDAVIVIDSASGDLTIDGDDSAELSIDYTEKFQGTSYSYSIDLDGDAVESGEGVELELDGDFVDSFNDSYSADAELDCEADGDEMNCEGTLSWEGYSVDLELEFTEK